MPNQTETLRASETLRDIRAWLEFALKYGPVETRGSSDASGHPHSYAVVLIPDWQVKQKLANVIEALAQDGGIAVRWQGNQKITSTDERFVRVTK